MHGFIRCRINDAPSPAGLQGLLIEAAADSRMRIFLPPAEWTSAPSSTRGRRDDQLPGAASSGVSVNSPNEIYSWLGWKMSALCHIADIASKVIWQRIAPRDSGE
jgi:hypothetical protein